MNDGSRFDRVAGGESSLDRVDKGLNLLFAAEVTREVLEAVDVQALEADAHLDEAVDFEQLAGAVGQPVGRLAAVGATKGVLGGGVAGLVAREVAGRAGARALRAAFERTDPEAFLAVLRSESPPGAVLERGREAGPGTPNGPAGVDDLGGDGGP